MLGFVQVRSLACAALLLATGVFSGVAEAGSLKWHSDYETARKQARAESKPILAMFTASWCGPCRKMKSSTLSDPGVEHAIEASFIPVMIDTDANPSVTRRFGVSAMPTIIVIDPVTESTEKTRGYQGTSQFMSFLNQNKRDIQTVAAVVPPKMPKPTGEGKDGEVELSPYCLVTAINEGTLEKGDPSVSLKKEGYVLYFVSKKERDQFESDPAKYWPQLSGFCPVTLVEKGKWVQGELRWVIEFRNRYYMCHSKEHAEKFIDSPSRYADAAQEKLSMLSTK